MSYNLRWVLLWSHQVLLLLIAGPSSSLVPRSPMFSEPRIGQASMESQPRKLQRALLFQLLPCWFFFYFFLSPSFCIGEKKVAVAQLTRKYPKSVLSRETVKDCFPLFSTFSSIFDSCFAFIGFWEVSIHFVSQDNSVLRAGGKREPMGLGMTSVASIASRVRGQGRKKKQPKKFICASHVLRK